MAIARRGSPPDGARNLREIEHEDLGVLGARDCQLARTDRRERVARRQLLATDLDVVANDECNIAIKAIYAKALKSSIADLASQYRIRPDAGCDASMFILIAPKTSTVSIRAVSVPRLQV